MSKQLGFYEEIQETIIDSCNIRNTKKFTEWLENIMKEFYDYNKKTFLTLNEKETDILRKKFCETQTTASISKEHGMIPCNVTECIRRKKREIIRRISVMYRLQTNKDTSLENALLWIPTVEELGKLELKKIEDITKLSKREFMIITSIIPKKMQEEVLNMLKTYRLEFTGPEIVIEEDDSFIDELNLSYTTVKSLFWCGIKTKTQIMNLSKEDVKRIIGLGPDGYSEIMNLFKKENKKLKEVSENNTQIDLTNIPIERLNLNTRAIQALYRNNIRTIDELLKVPEQRLKNMKGLGAKSFYELKEKIRYIGYKFPEEEHVDRLDIITKKIEMLEEEKEYLLYISEDKTKILKKGDK